MVLRNYIKEDAAIICKWLRTEEELYRWSADRFNKFPLLETDINNNYMPQIETRRFIPLTAVDEKENLLGHFIIRYPREEEGHIYHLFNPQRLSMKEIGELMIENGVNIKSVSVKEFCEYLKDNMEKYKDLISNITMVTYVREKDIEQLIDLCLKCDRTTQILANYGLEWNSLDKKHMADIINIIK